MLQKPMPATDRKGDHDDCPFEDARNNLLLEKRSNPAMPVDGATVMPPE